MSFKKYKLKDLVENFSIRARDYGGSDGLEFLGVSNDDGIVKSKSAAEHKGEEYKIIEKGCFAYNPYRINIGSIAYHNEDVKGLISPAYVIFKTKPNSIKDNLLFKFLKSAEGLRQIRFHGRGTVRQALRFEDLCKIEISIPTFEDQEKLISNIEKTEFESNLISSELTHQLDLIKQLRQSFLREAMQGKLVKSTNANEIGQQLLTKIKAEKAQLIKTKKLKVGLASSQSINLVDDYVIPNNWTWCKADEIFFITKLAGFEYSKNIRLMPSGEIPVIRAQNVRPLEIKKTNLLYIDRETSLLLDRCALTKKCLLVTFIGAGIGDVSTFNETERWHLAPNVAKMEPFIGCENLLNVKFINFFLMSDIGQIELFKHVKATAQPSLSMGTLRDIDIPLPSTLEQDQIVVKLEELMAFCDGLEQSIKESQGYNEMLLQQVLTEALQPKKQKV
jgi:type I restriction enzyme S subunit